MSFSNLNVKTLTSLSLVQVRRASAGRGEGEEDWEGLARQEEHADAQGERHDWQAGEVQAVPALPQEGREDARPRRVCCLRLKVPSVHPS